MKLYYNNKNQPQHHNWFRRDPITPPARSQKVKHSFWVEWSPVILNTQSPNTYIFNRPINHYGNDITPLHSTWQPCTTKPLSSQSTTPTLPWSLLIQYVFLWQFLFLVFDYNCSQWLNMHTSLAINCVNIYTFLYYYQS